MIEKISLTNHSIQEINSSSEEQTASIEEVSATANRLGLLAENLKNELSEHQYTEKTKDKLKLTK